MMTIDSVSSSGFFTFCILTFTFRDSSVSGLRRIIEHNASNQLLVFARTGHFLALFVGHHRTLLVNIYFRFEHSGTLLVSEMMKQHKAAIVRLEIKTSHV